MIPVRLSISGFLSYRAPVEIDFTSFELACISGPNGAGKSSLLDAITWALFGQARKRDDSVINQGCTTAEVSLVFSYEGNIYQVRRIKPRDKTMTLEFQILQSPGESSPVSERTIFGAWKPLTERTLRETEARIMQTLRMDYETFTNASFFLQGKADLFTQQRSSERKRILGSILGLEIWETYRERANERRRQVEASIGRLDGQLKEIAEELGEEEQRVKRLKELEADLKRLGKQRQAQEDFTKVARQWAVRLEEQKRLVDQVARQVETNARRLEEARSRLEMRRQDEKTYHVLLEKADQIEAAHAGWQAMRLELSLIEKVAEQFRDFEKQREGPRGEIQAARARLEQERLGLRTRQEEAALDLEQASILNSQGETAREDLKAAEGRKEEGLRLEVDLQAKRQEQVELRAENSSLKPEMDKLKERIDRLGESDEAECPLCGQPLSTNDRLALIEQLKTEGQEKGDRHRANRARLQELDEAIRLLENEIGALSQSEAEIRQHMARLAQIETQLAALAKRDGEWQAVGAKRLAEVQLLLDKDDFEPEARRRLAEIDLELKKTGYDAAEHDRIRQEELSGRDSEAALRELGQARAALAPIGREILDLEKQLAEFGADGERLKSDYEKAAAALADAQAQAPDLIEAETRLLDLQEEENRRRMEVGAAKQEVAVLENQKRRRKAFEAEREQLGHQVQRYRQLERAFGKDGVPALLIEQALPEIESKANETLDRLSDGSMSVQFVTQAKYRDKTREDLKETLDIVISDGAGKRDYEMFSGGEAFRVNFAIRLALSEVLAQRAGARLQTLVIDEGFGSQDTQGRQRLIEAINLVRRDFAKILVITHIDELKDAFPNRIEVEKTTLGSTVAVI
jgi:exonuclease SbcC